MTIRRFSSQSEDMTNKHRNSEPGLGSNRWHRPSKEQNLKLEGTNKFLCRKQADIANHLSVLTTVHIIVQLYKKQSMLTHSHHTDKMLH